MKTKMSLLFTAFALLLLLSTVNPTLAQNRGGQIIKGFERLERRASSNAAQIKTSGETAAPDSDGTLDPTFGTGGRVMTVSPDNDNPFNITLQPDGKMLVACSVTAGNNLVGSYVIRYNADGSIDTGFASNGFFRIADVNDSLLYDAAVLPDGKILVAADKFDATLNVYDFAAFRLNPNGSRDTTFGANGLIIVLVSAGNDFNTFGLIVQPDGKFILAGQSQRSGSAVRDVGAARLNANGTLDTSFGTNGKLSFQVLPGNNNANLSEIAAQTDGKIVLLGSNSVGNLSDEKMFVSRLNADGTFDNSFGTNGTRLSDFNTIRNNASDLAIQSDGKIVFTTFNFDDSNFQGSTIVRYNQNGSNDTTFGINGAVNFPITANENFGASVLIQPNGKVILGGTVFTPEEFQAKFALLRLNPNGTRDASFGSNGVVSTAVSYDNFIGETVLQPDGKLVALGTVSVNAVDPFDVGLARFLPDTPAAPPFFDFDGDGRADISVYRSGTWFRLNSANNSFSGAQFGAATDKITPADFDGDARSDLAVFRNGVWFILQSATNSVRAVQFGQAGDVPMPGDYDADGKADVAVFRAGTWFIQSSSNNSFRGEQFGAATDKPVSGDFDADGKQDLAV